MRVKLLFFAATLVVATTTGHAEPPVVLGLVETVRLMPEGIDLDAKVDTGAQHSSLDVSRWEEFTRDGKSWVRFTLRAEGTAERTLERPLVRLTRIVSASGKQWRPVVRMVLCVGKTAKAADVNLTNRPNMSRRMLLGASYLTGDFLVDVSRKYLTTPACDGAAR